MRTLVRSALILLISLIAGPAALAAGDVEKGKVLYNICTACHGANAEGNPALNAPANAGQDPWYLTRQLKNFRVGIRGAHPDDTFGAQMRPMAMMLAGEDDIADVVAYLTSMQMPEPAPRRIRWVGSENDPRNTCRARIRLVAAQAPLPPP